MPMTMENLTAMIIAATGTAAEYPRIEAAMAPSKKPTRMPKIPPMRHNIMDSIINWKRMELFFAPNAFLVPISRVLSVMDTSMIFITPMPPTKSEMPAINEIAMETVPIISLMDSVMDSIVVVETL